MTYYYARELEKTALCSRKERLKEMSFFSFGLLQQHPKGTNVWFPKAESILFSFPFKYKGKFSILFMMTWKWNVVEPTESETGADKENINFASFPVLFIPCFTCFHVDFSQRLLKIQRHLCQKTTVQLFQYRKQSIHNIFVLSVRKEYPFDCSTLSRIKSTKKLLGRKRSG